MKILLDEYTPRVVKKRLPALTIRTVQELGWTGIRNGDLRDRAELQFDVLITTDKDLRYQQTLTGRRIAILLLPSNQVPVVVQLLPAIEQALQALAAGAFAEIPFP